MNMFDLSGDVAVRHRRHGRAGRRDCRGPGGSRRGGGGAGAQRGARPGARQSHPEQREPGQRFFSTDAVKRETLQAAHQAIEKALGAPTILVNAAGGNDPKVTVTAERPFEQITLADWAANFDLNLVGGVLLPCQEFGPAMVARGKGSIINIASVSGHIAAVAGRHLLGRQSGSDEPFFVPGARMGVPKACA